MGYESAHNAHSASTPHQTHATRIRFKGAQFLTAGVVSLFVAVLIYFQENLCLARALASSDSSSSSSSELFAAVTTCVEGVPGGDLTSDGSDPETKAQVHIRYQKSTLIVGCEHRLQTSSNNNNHEKLHVPVIVLRRSTAHPQTSRSCSWRVGSCFKSYCGLRPNMIFISHPLVICGRFPIT